MWIARIASALVFLASLAAFAAEEPPAASRKPPERVIFVGNSLTQYNDLPALVREIARSLDTRDRLETRQISVGGAYLYQHEESLKQALARGPKWDLVVLQGYSDEPLESNPQAAERFRGSARTLDRMIRDAGAKTALYMTWGYRLAFGMNDKIADAYRRLGKDLGAQVVPVGLAFDRAGSEARFVTLIERDGKHPTPAGSYLAACVFYAALYGRSPEGATFYGKIAREDAAQLQAIAWKTVKAFAQPDATGADRAAR